MTNIVLNSQLRSVELEHPDYTLYRYVGIPYGGLLLGKYDLHETVFDTTTDVGPLNRDIPVFFEHGLFPDVNFDQMGVARILDQETIDGRLFDVVVDKANKYHDFLYRLYKEGLLFGSAQAIASSYRLDKETRKMQRFIPAEWSFTVQPSNVLSRPVEVVRSIFNEYQIDYLRNISMADVNNTVTEVSTPVAAPEAPAAVAPVTARMDEILGRAAAPAQPAPAANPELAAVATVLRGVVDKVEGQSAVLADLRSKQLTAETLGAFEKRLGDLENSLVRFADEVIQRLDRAISTKMLDGILSMSEDERAVVARRAATQSERQATNNAPAAQQQDNGIATVTVAPPGLNRNGGR